jgi:hypothetical protein
VATEREELEQQARRDAMGLPTREVPPPLSEGALIALDALEQFARGSVADLDQWHREMFLQYHEELEQYFRRYATPGRRLDPDRTPPDVWSIAAVQDRVPDDLATSFEALSEALYDTDVAAMEDWLDDALIEGHQRELWLLALSGLDIEPYLDSLPKDEDDRSALLLALGVLGVSWLARRAAWRDDITRRVSGWVRGSIIGGQTLEGTLDGFDRLTDTFTDRVQGLVENELVRAHSTGGEVALTAAQQDHAIAEVWLTRTKPGDPRTPDALVCGICAPRHMKVTPLQPITDSHPGCRCRKVPVPTDFEHTDVAYEDLFTSAFGGE